MPNSFTFEVCVAFVFMFGLKKTQNSNFLTQLIHYVEQICANFGLHFLHIRIFFNMGVIYMPTCVNFTLDSCCCALLMKIKIFSLFMFSYDIQQFIIIYVNVKFNLNLYKYHGHENAHDNLPFPIMLVGLGMKQILEKE